MSLKQELQIWDSALKAFDKQDYPGALQQFEAIADTSKILFNMGVIHATLGEHEGALARFDHALSLDPFFAVALFQSGVSSFLLGRYEVARRDFEDALALFHHNHTIDYTQLGLDFKLYSCEVRFNRGLTLGQGELGMQDLLAAKEDKQTDWHDVIDEGYTVFSIPVGIVFRPSETKLQNLERRDYLGKATVIAAASSSDLVIALDGSVKMPATAGVAPPLNTRPLTPAEGVRRAKLPTRSNTSAGRLQGAISPPSDISGPMSTSRSELGRSKTAKPSVAPKSPPARPALAPLNTDIASVPATRVARPSPTQQFPVSPASGLPRSPSEDFRPPPNLLLARAATVSSRPQRQKPDLRLNDAFYPVSQISPTQLTRSATTLALSPTARSRSRAISSPASPYAPALTQSPPPRARRSISVSSVEPRSPTPYPDDEIDPGWMLSMLQYRQDSSTKGESSTRLSIPQMGTKENDAGQKPPESTVYDVISQEWMASEAGGSAKGAGKIRSIPLDLTLASFVERVRFKLKSEYDLPIRFRDSDGALISLQDEEDWQCALDQAREAARGLSTGKLDVLVDNL
ncbi:neutrophil cytosolic factor 2 [Rhodotorula toruloides]|uniref:Neutrophil cytosolic factor 2 n=1 Tax=Rhodotorula toruloides TaxID=5286 RepID=A0A511K8J3_RHOTO|nr:neutrophil cytosolic factor 2 [Rhodotorula toruloides]